MYTFEEQKEWLMERFKIDDETAEKMLAILGEARADDDDDDEDVIVNNA